MELAEPLDCSVRALRRGHGAGITMQAERSRIVDSSVPQKKDKYRWRGEFCEESSNGFFHGGSKAERDSIFEKSRNRADTFGQVG